MSGTYDDGLEHGYISGWEDGQAMRELKLDDQAIEHNKDRLTWYLMALGSGAVMFALGIWSGLHAA